ncbi:hypothetical protein KAFR_0J00370 [Kazachstania africana CBS 2517]|uniref:Ribosome-recycling factor, mitochondrial n=1 Tax=Kazachstania africana (strain ATCC 22294 / BCRC 22015 / CBS 2517 / CECT 1963 / NBRC 1671 / NRRL Y-8276) TaxID=1071382 RepID=H2B0F5_KAZAF|nr:hypothetical protein KAFR_0J00370 [Kazachstania africana CBS 2517]CCF60105.1 hypothetical protein KAFR_0J00370 [Kazachstania africana CBS 2517]
MLVLRRTIRSQSYLIRPLHTSRLLLKKKNRGSKANEDDIEVVDLKLYLNQAKERYSKILELQKQKLVELKQGNANPNIFNALVMPSGKKFTDIAITSLRGKNSLLVTVFNPKDTKNVVSTILAANLNLTPERLPDNEQQLRIMLPPPTAESRLKVIKDSKELFESFKSSNSKHSMGSIRRDILDKLKGIQMDDFQKKCIKDLETIHKDYMNQLKEQYKKFESTFNR